MTEIYGHSTGEVTGDREEDDRVYEWEAGLPTADELPPLTQGLVPARLLLAFNIRPIPSRSSGEVSRASDDTLSRIRGQLAPPTTNLKETIADEETEDVSGSESKISRRNDSPDEENSSKTLKRHRLVWTPQLHKRFVEVVGHLGIKSAVPKTIMQLMNVEGLTRENVASHLQKYRQYLKRMDCEASNSYSDSPFPRGNSNDNGNTAGAMMGMGSLFGGFESNHHHHHHHHHHHQEHGQYGNGMMMMMMQSGNKYGSVIPYHHQPSHVPPGDNS